MNTKQELHNLITDSFRFQKFIFNGVGIVAGPTGIVILILSFTIPAKPGEEQILLGLQITSVVFIIFAVWFPWFINNRLQQIKKIIFEQKEKIKEVKPFTVTKNGIPGFAVRIITTDNKMLGFNVQGPKTQAKAVELITQLMKE